MITKTDLTDLQAEFQKFEDEARKLKNQNLADVIASAKGKIQQLSEHPDLELVNKPDAPAYGQTDSDPAGQPVHEQTPSAPYVPPQTPPNDFP